MGKLRTFIRLDRADRLATLEAMARLTLAHLLVWHAAPRRWRDLARVSPGGHRTSRRQDDIPLSQILRVRHAIVRARRNLPFEVKCLPQAVAAQQMLERIGVPGDLRIGALVNDGVTDRFHAWLKVGDVWVTGDCNESDYAVFETIDGQPA